MSTVCDPFQPHFRNANVPQKGRRNMSSPANHPGTSPNQSMLHARINPAHSAGKSALNFASRLQFLHLPTASVPPRMCLISKDRFSPNTGSLRFIFPKAHCSAPCLRIDASEGFFSRKGVPHLCWPLILKNIQTPKSRFRIATSLRIRLLK